MEKDGPILIQISVFAYYTLNAAWSPNPPLQSPCPLCPALPSAVLKKHPASSSPARKATRPPLERMLQIHERLRAGKPVNCTRLTRDLEVCRKTIIRDIEFMRDRLKLPIVYDEIEYSYRYTEEVTAFPTVQVSEGEVVSLLVAQKAMEQYRGTPFEGTLASAFGKIVEGLRDSVSFQPPPGISGISFRNIGASTADLRSFELLNRAINERQALAFSYLKLAAGQPEKRLVHPYHLACVQGAWYLVAFDPARQGLRTFALSRISEPSLQRESFERQPGFSPESYFANSFGVFAGEGTQLVVVRFDALASRLVRERFWHSSQQLRDLKDGCVELSLRVSSLTELRSWILGWGSHARVLKPVRLADEIREEARKVLASYGD